MLTFEAGAGGSGWISKKFSSKINRIERPANKIRRLLSCNKNSKMSLSDDAKPHLL